MSLDLREPMRLAAGAIAARLDREQNWRPWFMLRGRGGVPVCAEHSSWDLGDMTGRYLEGLIFARRMGVDEPELRVAEQRLRDYLLSLIGEDGLVHDPQSGAIDHPFSHGSALYGLLAWFEDTGDAGVQRAIEKMIRGILARLVSHDGQMIEPAAKLPQSSGSHLSGYQIFPAICFYERTRFPDALELCEHFTRWAMADPVLGADGAITLALSWEGHIHSWLDTLAGCVRTVRHSSSLNKSEIIARCRAVYDWVRCANSTDFGWIATFPGHGSCETCAISSAIRLALELVASGYPQYLNDVERFVRNQAIEAQFRDLSQYAGAPEPVTPLLLGCFDSQSLPNGHLGTRGGEDVGIVEGCCLNGGMRAIYLSWDAAHRQDSEGVSIDLLINRTSDLAGVVDYQPEDGRIEIVSNVTTPMRIRLPDWLNSNEIAGRIDNHACELSVKDHYACVPQVRAGSKIILNYTLRRLDERVTILNLTIDVGWIGDTVVSVTPPGAREPTYQGRYCSPI